MGFGGKLEVIVCHGKASSWSLHTKGVLSNMKTPSQMWLFNFNLNKLKVNINILNLTSPFSSTYM